MKKLIIRALSGLIYVGLILGCFFGGYNWFLSLVIMFALLAYQESTHIAVDAICWRNAPVPLADMVAIIALLLTFVGIWPLWTVVAAIIVRCVIQLFVHEYHPARRLAISFFQIFYLGIGLGSMLAIAEVGKAVLAILFIIWLNDTGAYASGSLLGRHKLCPEISPKKTWEGFIGGLIICLCFSTLCCVSLNDWFAFLPHSSLWQWLLIATITVLCATWGDLIESLIKRNLKIKDSGNIIPGHGGILDRIDSLLLAMPAVWCLLYLLGIF